MGQINPADGERRALAGYLPQYATSASLILKALMQRTLEWVRIADPEAGRVDDFQIGTHNRADAFQVKWSTYPGAVTWTKLTKDEANAPSLIRQLADGWQRLRAKRPNLRVVVHLVTNELPSKNDDLPTDATGATRKHLAAFLAQAWEPWRKDLSAPFDSIALPWRYTMGQLRVSSGLSETDFSAFAADCELEFGIRLPSASFLDHDSACTEKDIEHIQSRLFDAIRSPQNIVELSCEELLRFLGWTDLFRLTRKHEFPVDDTYRPIADTVAAVNDAINRLHGGYLAVIGSPGSGKSTLLTHLLRYRPERVIRYYAYIPSSSEPLAIRGESVSLLHDLVVELANSGVSAGDGTSSLGDRVSLLETFHRQLQALGREFATTRRKTLILIDGLDHVPREYYPDRSFLLDLPLPTAIPDGVLFIVGSQTDELADIPRAVRDSFRISGRHIEVGRLGRSVVYEIVGQALLDRNISDDQKEAMFNLCDGHPLALRYLLNRLEAADDIEQALQDATRFEGDITQSYATYWSTILERDPAVAHLLALICRMQPPVDMTWVTKWNDDTMVGRLIQHAGHYFRRETDTRWSVFHNSFRIYVQQESAKSSLGQFDESRDKTFHQELATAFASHGSGLQHRLKELYHRSKQGDYRAVLEMSQQSLFRDMVYAGLPLGRVFDGIHLGIRAAGQLLDDRALVRLALSLKEVSQRNEDEDEGTVIDILMELGECDSAIEHLRDGPRLIGSYDTALACSVKLLESGRIVDAKSLFDLAEPMDVLTRHVQVERSSPQYDRAALDSWASAAVHFRGTAATLRIITALQVDRAPDFPGLTREKFLADIRNKMRLEAGEELLSRHQWADYRLVRDTLDPLNEDDCPYWLRLTIDAIREAHSSDNSEVAQGELATLTQTVSMAKCNDLTRTAIAECIYRVGNIATSALQWIDGLPQPSLVDSLQNHQARDLSPWRQRIRLNSLLYALTDNHPEPRMLIPDSADPAKLGMVAFERAVCQLAYLRGRRWRGEAIRRENIDQELLGLLRFYYRDHNQTREWHDWYYIQNVRQGFYRELIAEIAQHNSGCLEQLMASIEREWADSKAYYWPIDTRRAVVLEALSQGMPHYWVTQHLEAFDDEIEGFDVSGRKGQYGEQAKAWLKVGNTERSRACLERMRKCAIGVGYRKDYQANVWIRRLREHLADDPDDAPRLIAWIARAIVTLEDTTERAAIQAAQELMEVAFEISPRNAVRLAQWFCKRRIRWWHRAGLESIGCAASQSSLNSTDLLLAVCVDLFIPLATYVTDGDVPEKVSCYVLKHLPRGQALKTLDSITSVADVLALACTRGSWRNGCDQALQRMGLSPRHAAGESGDDGAGAESISSTSSLPPAKVRMKDGRELSEEEVQLGCTTFDGLLILLRQSVDKVYSYGWDSVIRPRISQLDRNQLISLIEPLRAKSQPALLVRIGHRLCELGDLTSAQELAQEVLKSTLRFSDEWEDERGGASAIGLLRKIDPAKAKTAAFEAVVREMTQHSYVGYEVAVRIPAFLKLLDSELLPEMLWSEVEDHLHALFDETDIQHIPAPELVWNDTNDTPAQALVDLLLAHACHPCNQVRLAAMRGLARAVRAGCAEATESIGRALNGPEWQQWHLVRLVEALSLEEPDRIRPWKSEIINLGTHPNYAIRAIGRSVCKRLGWTASSPSARPALPVTYNLWLPDNSHGTPIIDGPPAPGQVFPDTDNPEVMIRPFHRDAEMLAEMAHIEPNAVFARMATLMRLIEPQETWTSNAEKQLLEELQHVGPMFPYARVRAEVARRAMFHVAAELSGAGRIGSAELAVFFRYTRPHDPSMLLQIGQPRPEHLAIPEERQYPKTIEEWRLEAKPDTCLISFDGFVVLAEDTHFNSLGDDHTKERRQSAVLPTDRIDESTGRSVGLWRRLHEVVIGGTAGNYQSLDEVPDDLAVANRLDGCDSPGCDWLAANPAMANRFSWRYEGGHWFRWVDENGNLMVKSFWWQDGLLAHIDRSLHSWVGEGWLVLASASAIQRIEDEVGPLSRVSCVTRSAGHEEHGQTAIKISTF